MTDHLLRTAIAAARLPAPDLNAAFRRNMQVDYKRDRHDPVTEHDRRAEAQIRVNNLSGPGKNPAFPAAKQAAEAAAAQYQQLLDQYRQEFLLPRAVDQSALESIAAINVVERAEEQLMLRIRGA